MENKNTHIFTFNTFEDIDLYELSETTRNEDYKKLSQWICHYKYREIEAHNSDFLIQKRKEYKHEFEVMINLIDSYIKMRKSNPSISLKYFIEIFRIKKRIRFMCYEIFRHISISDLQRKRLNLYLKKNQYTEEFRSFLIICYMGDDQERQFSTTSEGSEKNLPESTLKDYMIKMFSHRDVTSELSHIDTNSFMVSYEEKLKDHIFLLDELVEILCNEYDHRLISTKTRFEKYLRPRKRVLEKIDEEINEIEEDMALLGEDENIGKEDREKLILAFKHKHKELKELKHQEYEKLNSIKMVSLNIKNGVNQFRDVISQLKKKLRYFKKRQFYVEKLARYGAEIPRFKNILDDLYTTFNSQIKTLQKSFLMFDVSFQQTILHAIDDQSVINRIILSPHGVVDAELAIENADHDSKADVSQENGDEIVAEIMDEIELDLSFLQPYEDQNEEKEKSSIESNK